MGKKLIIKGADFSINAIGRIDPTPTPIIDISDLFTWKESWAIQVTSASTTPYDRRSIPTTSSVAKTSQPLDVTEYRGKTLRFTGMAWQASSGLRTRWGSQFYSSLPSIESPETTKFIEEPFYWCEDSGTPSWGYVVEDVELVIPEDAEYFVTTFFMDSTLPSGASFKAEIVG